ncbi:MAG TPA: prepilin-type N-terminal cleavage/methylation domain-containing protein [Tepidisphaeraceae bacterium]|nr:prepilin-type N-terminal cleavage/methylation domain-containing protein [Tepidisphaeraceae bacterium]
MSCTNEPLRSELVGVAAPVGFTLIEMVMALGITAILLTALVSAMMLAGKAVPSASDSSTGTLAGGGVADQIAGELETSLLVLEQTPTAITFLVNPRNNDTHPERIRYSWGGTSGSPLLRQYNQGTPAVMIPQVNQFSLTPALATSIESYPGAAVEDSSESLLFDYSGTTSPAALSVSGGDWAGQYFGSTSWPPGVVGWRPTRLLFQGKQSGLLGTSAIQMCPALANLTPSGTVLEQYTNLGLGLLSSYSWQQYSFTTASRLAPSAGLCFTFQSGGLLYSIDLQSNAGAGLLQSSNSGGTWSYSANRSLQSQLYGKLTRSGPTQYAISRYLSALTIGLRASPSTNPMVTTTAQSLNHPELLSAYWEAKFDQDPTTLDVNADGIPDWSVQGGAKFNLLTLLNDLWQPNGTTLLSQPGNNFQQVTVVDVRFNATASGSWAQLSLNAARNGSSCAPVLARITMQSDGTQTLNVWRKLNDSTTDALLTIPGLAAGPTDAHLVIDPSYGTVGITVNSVQYGAFFYQVFTSTDKNTSVVLSSSGSAQFGHVRVREFQPS